MYLGCGFGSMSGRGGAEEDLGVHIKVFGFSLRDPLKILSQRGDIIRVAFLKENYHCSGENIGGNES